MSEKFIYKSLLEEKEGPFGWIQFKGTDICIDVHCECGGHSHFDGYFLYFVECPYCGNIYELNGNIELIKREESFDEIDKNACIYTAEK